MPEFSKLFLYSTQGSYYVVGKSKSSSRSDDRCWAILTLKRAAARSKDPDLSVHETPSLLTQAQCSATLRQLHAGNVAASPPGLQLVCKAYGIIGCVRFLECHYLMLITKREQQGSICGHKVYSVSDTALIPLVQPSGQGRESSAEKKYRKLLLGMDMTHDFFFSYTYSIAMSLQRNLTAPASSQGAGRFDSMFVWNCHLTRPLREAVGTERWVVPLIHGFWQQRTLAVLGQPLTITLVARRSRHFAGTRYQKRGVNHEGRVANDVEMEQIVSAGIDRRHGTPHLSSMVQVRGSFPLYWSQQGGKLGKPDILLQNFDPLFSATRSHFADMQERYSSPVICLDLVKAAEKSPREIVLRSEFDTAISYINQSLPEEERVVHLPWDLNFHAKSRGAALLDSLVPLLHSTLDATHLFVHHNGDQGMHLQAGVVRTNCVDCLDRTNVAQFAVGLAALGRQLQALSLSDGPDIDARSSLARHLMDLYEAAGNTIARQYGGSEAHSTFFQRQRGDWEAATQSRDLMTSIRRFYSNAYTDADKQAAINLFLGNFVPEPGRPALWELDNDNYLHFTTGLNRGGSDQSLRGSSSLSSLGGRARAQSLDQSLDHPSATAASIGAMAAFWRAQEAPSPAAQAHSRALAQFGGQPGGGTMGTGTRAVARQRSSIDSSGVGMAAARLQRMLSEEAAAVEAVRRLARPPVLLPPSRTPSLNTLRRSVTQQHVARASSPDIACMEARSLSTPAICDSQFSTAPDSPGEPPSDAQPAAASQGSHDVPSYQRGTYRAASLPDLTASSSAPEDEEAAGAPAATGAIRGRGVLRRRSSAPEDLVVSTLGSSSLPASPVRRRAKLESLDKLIGQPPDIMHHVRLHAPPSQRAYLPHWLGTPLVRLKTADKAAGSTAAVAEKRAQELPSIAENGRLDSGASARRSASSSLRRRPSADINNTAPIPIKGVRRTHSTDSGLLRFMSAPHPPVPPQQPASQLAIADAARRQSLIALSESPGLAVMPGASIYTLDASNDVSLDDPLFADRAAGVLSNTKHPAGPRSGQSPGVGPKTDSKTALTAVGGSRGPRWAAAAGQVPTLGQLLSTDANGLGVSPFLLASWLSAEDHLSMWTAAETSLLSQYQQFMGGAQSMPPPQPLRNQYADLCRVPSMPLVSV